MFKVAMLLAVFAIGASGMMAPMMEGDMMMMMAPAMESGDMMMGEMMMEEMMAPTFPNIVDAAVATDDLSSLVAAVTAADLVDTLADPMLEATVFAPTNAAFEAALAALDLTFDELANDTDTLTAVLLYHVVPAKALSTDLVCGMTLPTLGGVNLTVDLSQGVVIKGVGSSASVLSGGADVTAGKGVVHIVDTVLLPFTL